MDNLNPSQYQQYLMIAEYSETSAERYLLFVTSEKYRQKKQTELNTLALYTNEQLERIIEKRELAIVRKDLAKLENQGD